MKIAIFASGGGSNAQAIINYFTTNASANVALIISNREHAGVIEKAKAANIPFEIISRTTLNNEHEMMDILRNHQIDFIVLAGFLLLIPDFLCRHYPHRIVNIHPALLPKYGGKGMYGHFVHQAVKAAGERESGITIHFVNEKYDEGGILFQAKTTINPEDTPEEIAAKVLQLEHAHYPKIIDVCIRLQQDFFEEE